MVLLEKIHIILTGQNNIKKNHYNNKKKDKFTNSFEKEGNPSFSFFYIMAINIL